MVSKEDFHAEGLKHGTDVHHHEHTEFAITHHPDRKGDKKYHLHGDGGQTGGYDHVISKHKTFSDAVKAHDKYHKKK